MRREGQRCAASAGASFPGIDDPALHGRNTDCAGTGLGEDQPHDSHLLPDTASRRVAAWRRWPCVKYA